MGVGYSNSPTPPLSAPTSMVGTGVGGMGKVVSPKKKRFNPDNTYHRRDLPPRLYDVYGLKRPAQIRAKVIRRENAEVKANLVAIQKATNTETRINFEIMKTMTAEEGGLPFIDDYVETPLFKVLPPTLDFQMLKCDAMYAMKLTLRNDSFEKVRFNCKIAVGENVLHRTSGLAMSPTTEAGPPANIIAKYESGVIPPGLSRIIEIRIETTEGGREIENAYVQIESAKEIYTTPILASIYPRFTNPDMIKSTPALLLSNCRDLNATL